MLGGQRVHEAVPKDGAYVPGEHGLQLVLLLELTGLKVEVPLEQGAQLTAPRILLYEPAGHWGHDS